MYAIMSAYVKRGTSVSSVGQRQVAEIMDIGRNTVARLQHDLGEWGHVREIPATRGYRAQFEMLNVAAAKPHAYKKRGSDTVRRAASTAVTTREEIARILA